MISKLKQYWKWIVIALGSLFLYLFGGKKQKDKAVQATIEKDLYRKESEMLEKVRKRENRKIIESEIKYKKAIADLEKKYDDEKSELIREKDHIYKEVLNDVKDNPRELDNFLNAMGINEVKK